MVELLMMIAIDLPHFSFSLSFFLSFFLSNTTSDPDALAISPAVLFLTFHSFQSHFFGLPYDV